MYDRNQVLVKRLPAAVCVKDFIEGHAANYEEYLTDFVNASKLVEEKNGEIFSLRNHSEQSSGESDIYNDFYDLDFKLLVDMQYMEAISVLSNSITELDSGVIVVGRSKQQGRKVACDIIKCLRGKDLNQLLNVENLQVDSKEKRVIKQAIKKFSIAKNIFFFLPYNYFIKYSKTDEKVAKFIVECISDDLKGILEYRKIKSEKDTYISFISNGYFVVAKEINSEFIFYDMVEIRESKLFVELLEITKWF